MRSKSFETQEVRDSLQESRKVDRLSHLIDGNNGRCLPDGQKGMQIPGKIENVEKKIYLGARKVL